MVKQAVVRVGFELALQARQGFGIFKLPRKARLALLGFQAAACPRAAHPPRQGGTGQAKQPLHLLARRACLDRRHRTFPQIQRVGRCHHLELVMN